MGKSKTVGVVSLGCPKNLVDSEVMLGHLTKSGYEIIETPEKAETLIINTCGFIDKAKQESIDTILEMARYKRDGCLQRLVVTGCLAQRYSQQIMEELPEVDAVIGLDQLHTIDAVVAQKERVETSLKADGSVAYLYDHLVPKIQSTPAHYAYVKISEGCDYPCTFCIIPKIRGAYRSRASDSILAEVESLAQSGVKEICLIAQDTTRYGGEQGQRNGLASLLRRLANVSGIEWIRFLYAYPTTLDNEVLEVIASEPSLCRYVDIPLQHASDKVLKAMKRPGTAESNMNLIRKIRESVPDVSIRSSFIVGFPGETDADFESLMNFCKEAELDHLGVFTYSNEEDTEAFVPFETVSEEEKELRKRVLMEAQSVISLRKNQRRLGSSVRVLVEGFSEETELLLQGRTEHQAPGIDGVVLINGGVAEVGDFVEVKLTEAHPYDLVGHVVTSNNRTP